MSEQNAAQTPPVEDTSEVTANTPDNGTGTQDVNYQERYEQLRPEYTRTTQELAQYRQVIDALNSQDAAERQWAAEQLGLAFEEDEQPAEQPEELDPKYLALEERIAAFEQTQQQRDSQAQEDQFKSSVVSDLVKEGYPEGLRDLVAHMALDHARQSGQYDLDAAKVAVEDLMVLGADLPKLQNAVKSRWAETKRAPRITQAGSDGTSTPDLDNQATRREYMAQRLQDLNANQ